MVDLPGVDDIGIAILVYCLLKCSAEKADRHRRGTAGPPLDERRRFAKCYARCISPVDLPERTGGGNGDNDETS